MHQTFFTKTAFIFSNCSNKTASYDSCSEFFPCEIESFFLKSVFSNFILLFSSFKN